MSLSALTLAAALPAATGLAQCAAQAGQQLGSGFLNVLSGLASAGEEDAPAAADQAGDATRSPKPASLGRAQSWSERLMGWLGLDGAAGKVNMELSLDALDQPHISVEGEHAAEIEAALAADPTWMQEFRELALDRSAELGGPAGGAGSAPPPTLKIQQRDGAVQAAWQ